MPNVFKRMLSKTIKNKTTIFCTDVKIGRYSPSVRGATTGRGKSSKKSAPGGGHETKKGKIFVAPTPGGGFCLGILCYRSLAPSGGLNRNILCSPIKNHPLSCGGTLNVSVSICDFPIRYNILFTHPLARQLKSSQFYPLRPLEEGQNALIMGFPSVSIPA